MKEDNAKEKSSQDDGILESLRRPPTPDGFLSRQDRSVNARERSRERALASWVGEERRAGVFASLRRKTPSVETLVDSFLKKHTRPELQCFELVSRKWPEVVGTMNAKLSRPVKLQGKTLLVEVENATWLYVFRQHPLLPEWNATLCHLTEGKIQSIRFVATGRG